LVAPEGDRTPGGNGRHPARRGTDTDTDTAGERAPTVVMEGVSAVAASCDAIRSDTQGIGLTTVCLRLPPRLTPGPP
jgi:hypothetical protein